MSEARSHHTHAFGVDILTSQHKEIRRLKRNTAQATIHGNKFWRSSYLLMHYLQNNPPATGSKILELGCGWGLAGIHCAKHYQAEVTALDADESVFAFLQLHAQHNNVHINTCQQTFEQITTQQLSQYDTVIAADICFWDALASTVFEVIEKAVAAGVGTIIVADPERPPFFSMAERCIDEFCAEIEDYRLQTPHRGRGCLMIIKNS